MTKVQLGEQIAPGVSFNTIVDPRYKTDRISVNLMLKLDGKTASEYAVLPFILRKGYKDCPDFTQLNRRLNELYGAYLDADVRKIGDNQVLNLSIASIDDAFALDGEKMVEELSRILAGIVLSPNMPGGAFDPKEFELEKQYLIDTIESEINEKRTFAMSRAQSLLCEGEPYGESRYGTLDQAKGLTPELAAAAYSRAIRTAHVEILFVGCGAPEPAKRCFAEAFSGVERGETASIQSSVITQVREAQSVTERYQVAQSKMVLGFRATKELTGNDLDAMRLMVSLYGGTPISKLFVHVREEMSLCYYCAARFDRIKQILLVDCGVEKDNIDKAREEILRQLEEIRGGNFTDEELDNTRLSVRNSFKTIGDSPSGMESWYLGQRCSGTQRAPEEEADRLDAVTREDIVRAAQNVELQLVYVLTGMGE